MNTFKYTHVIHKYVHLMKSSLCILFWFTKSFLKVLRPESYWKILYGYMAQNMSRKWELKTKKLKLSFNRTLHQNFFRKTFLHKSSIINLFFGKTFFFNRLKIWASFENERTQKLYNLKKSLTWSFFSKRSSPLCLFLHEKNNLYVFSL